MRPWISSGGPNFWQPWLANELVYALRLRWLRIEWHRGTDSQVQYAVGTCAVPRMISDHVRSFSRCPPSHPRNLAIDLAKLVLATPCAYGLPELRSVSQSLACSSVLRHASGYTGKSMSSLSIPVVLSPCKSSPTRHPLVARPKQGAF